MYITSQINFNLLIFLLNIIFKQVIKNYKRVEIVLY
jgi:hypothetical protein